MILYLFFPHIHLNLHFINLHRTESIEIRSPNLIHFLLIANTIHSMYTIKHRRWNEKRSMKHSHDHNVGLVYLAEFPVRWRHVKLPRIPYISIDIIACCSVFARALRHSSLMSATISITRRRLHHQATVADVEETLISSINSSRLCSILLCTDARCWIRSATVDRVVFSWYLVRAT